MEYLTIYKTNVIVRKINVSPETFLLPVCTQNIHMFDKKKLKIKIFLGVIYSYVYLPLIRNKISGLRTSNLLDSTL